MAKKCIVTVDGGLGKNVSQINYGTKKNSAIVYFFYCTTCNFSCTIKTQNKYKRNVNYEKHLH